MTKKPSEYNKRLDEHLIDRVAYILYKARINCLNGYEPENGDTPWSNGVRSREWCRKAIRDAVGEFDFLEILKDKGQTFLFSINGVPIKFYKDNTRKPSSKLFKFQEIEQKQYDLFAFDGIGNPKDILWRFVIETDITLDISKIAFIGLNKKSKAIECLYETAVTNDDVRLIASLTPVENIQNEPLEEIEISYKSEEKKEKLNA